MPRLLDLNPLLDLDPYSTSKNNPQAFVGLFQKGLALSVLFIQLLMEPTTINQSINQSINLSLFSIYSTITVVVAVGSINNLINKKQSQPF